MRIWIVEQTNDGREYQPGPIAFRTVHEALDNSAASEKAMDERGLRKGTDADGYRGIRIVPYVREQLPI